MIKIFYLVNHGYNIMYISGEKCYLPPTFFKLNFYSEIE